MPLLLVALFIVVPLVELYVLLQVGQWIGVLPTIALLILDSVLGAVLLRAQGRTAWRRFQDALRSGRMPAREVFDGGLVIFGGALLLTPGFATDAFGLALLLPPTRALVRRVLVRGFARRFMFTMAAAGPLGGGGFGPGAGRRPGSPPGARAERPEDVEGTATEIDQERLP